MNIQPVRCLLHFEGFGENVEWLLYVGMEKIFPTLNLNHPRTGEEVELEFRGTCAKRPEIHKYKQKETHIRPPLPFNWLPPLERYPL